MSFCEKCGVNVPQSAAFCANCGAPVRVLVSDTALQTASTTKSFSEQASPTHVMPALWNPLALTNWNFLLTPVFGSYLLVENYKAMGRTIEAKNAKEWFYVAIAIILSPLLLSASGVFDLFFPILFLCYIAYLFSWYFICARKQRRIIIAEYGNNYIRQPWGKVLAIGVAANILWQILVRSI